MVYLHAYLFQMLTNRPISVIGYIITGLPTYSKRFPVQMYENTVHLPPKTVQFIEIRRKEEMSCKCTKIDIKQVRRTSSMC